ncbi:MAG: hypothetical protein IBJ18_02035 [Phycisphaerales bacterium]|nr:hypothetical protein [Phycisphaerales bacterium]
MRRKTIVILIALAIVSASVTSCILTTINSHTNISQSSIIRDKMVARAVADLLFTDKYAYMSREKKSLVINNQRMGIDLVVLNGYEDDNDIVYSTDKISIVLSKNEDSNDVKYIIVPRRLIDASSTVTAWRFYPDRYVDVIINRE